jgi:hypothetical protein
VRPGPVPGGRSPSQATQRHGAVFCSQGRCHALPPTHGRAERAVMRDFRSIGRADLDSMGMALSVAVTAEIVGAER